MKKHFRGKDKNPHYLNMTEKDLYEKDKHNKLCAQRKQIRIRLLEIKYYVKNHPNLMVQDEGELAATEQASRILGLNYEDEDK